MSRQVTIGYQDELPPALIAHIAQSFPTVAFVPLGDKPARAQHVAIITWGFDAELLQSCTNLQWIQTVAAGVDGLPLAEIAARHIQMTNASGLHATNIAEHVLAMMLSLSRRFPEFMRAQLRGEWLKNESIDTSIGELSGQSLLIVGLGSIGGALAKRAQALGMDVSAIRRSRAATPQKAFPVFGIDALPDRLSTADHVVVTLPLTDETRGMFGREQFAQVKAGACFYNIGRGPVVVTDALVEALESGHLAAAGLDVTDPEPLPSGHPLWTLPNVIITPHLSGATPHYSDRAAAIVSENLRRFVAGEPLNNIVDLSLGY